MGRVEAALLPIPPQLTRNRAWGPRQSAGDLSQAFSGSDQVSDHLSLGECKMLVGHRGVPCSKVEGEHQQPTELASRWLFSWNPDTTLCRDDDDVILQASS